MATVIIHATMTLQLLLKSTHARAKDTYDLERCLPDLDTASVAWLMAALRQQSPDHPWLRLLAR